ncbi:N-acetylmuramoyl-L-alanine amidase [Cetobacterium sp. 2A]|uniref:N-acetylmuramoyl-L-alanine amidase n=1 Tax=Cetobacterium sp. 2A TaxID=2754723 RepID=UPI00163CAED5|nr:N-acetylmuramoyl-L-alanine amidase [Cetobacterium sp. 2A]MBC2855313.1 N-acetylmuramoyl-L-alanine amidase [Cetobacterium sp. 2A]MBC2856809.1 N-acetylmuramoyl-L-alanine amidase [Cetobacterium sp. 2A]MBC2856850.1 N-acetylmuramoyl-L-alanine amidase [Cetobacterium sp. 2A]
MKRVILLAGHNFKDKGCHVNLEGKTINEFDLTTWIVAEIFKKERLINIDLVAKARNDYKDLVSEINSLNADILISCHFNASNGISQGTEVLYAHTSSKGKRLASVAQDILVKHLELNNRGIKATKQADRGGSILNKTKPVAILLEPFFLDSVKSFDELISLMDKTVDSIIQLLEHLEKNEL